MGTDAHEKLIFDCDFAALVVGRAGEFSLLVVTDNEPLDRRAIEAAAARGFSFCGTLAIRRGGPVVECEPGLDAAVTMLHASLAFARLVADRLRPPQPVGDSAEWLTRLFALPDERAEA